MVTDYDPITDDFLHLEHEQGDDEHENQPESFLVPPDANGSGSGGNGNGNSPTSPRKSYAKNEKKFSHKMRPKSAPKHRRRHPSPGEGYSNEEYYEESEEDLRVPLDDDEGSSACVSDQDYHQPPAKSADKISSSPKERSPKFDDSPRQPSPPKTKQISPQPTSVSVSPAGNGKPEMAHTPSSQKPSPVPMPSVEQAEKVN